MLDGQLGTTAIEDNASANARVVIDAMEDNPDQGAAGAKFTYSWSHLATDLRTSPDPTPWGQSQTAATVAAADAPSTTISTNFDTAGYYRVRFQVSIEFTPGTGEDIWRGTATAETTQTVIGGDFETAGLKTLRFSCNAPVTTNNPRTVSAPLQPVGTTWTWTTSAAISVAENAATPQPDGELKGIAASATQNADWVQITYSLGGASWTSPKHSGYTVRKPSSLTKQSIQHGGGNDPRGRFYLSKIIWLVKDQFGDPMNNLPVHEEFGQFTSSPNHPNENWPAPDAKQGDSFPDATFPDDFFIFDQGNLNPPVQIPDPNALTQDAVQSAQQSYYLGSKAAGQGCLLETGTLRYYVDHADHE